MCLDRLLGIDGLVAESDVDVLVTSDDLAMWGGMPFKMASVMNIRRKSCGHSPPSPTRVEKAPQVSHRCWPNARVPQPAHSYTVIGRRGRPRAGTTITLGRAWCRRRHAVFRQASEQ